MRTAFRILFTVLAATCGSVLLVMLFWETVFRTRRWIEFNPLADLYMSNHVAAEAISRGVVVLLPATALAVVIYSIFGWGHRYLYPETQCRKCRYILRGLTEPKCPECGTAI